MATTERTWTGGSGRSSLNWTPGRRKPRATEALAGIVLKTAGRTLISTVGGAAGPLYGTAFVRGGTAITGAPPELPPGVVLLSALEAAIGGIAGARQGVDRREDDARRTRPGAPRGSGRA